MYISVTDKASSYVYYSTYVLSNHSESLVSHFVLLKGFSPVWFFPFSSYQLSADVEVWSDWVHLDGLYVFTKYISNSYALAAFLAVATFAFRPLNFTGYDLYIKLRYNTFIKTTILPSYYQQISPHLLVTYLFHWIAKSNHHTYVICCVICQIGSYCTFKSLLIGKSFCCFHHINSYCFKKHQQV